MADDEIDFVPEPAANTFARGLPVSNGEVLVPADPNVCVKPIIENRSELLNLSAAVAMILVEFKSESNTVEWTQGTAFLVSPRHMLTNRHIFVRPGWQLQRIFVSFEDSNEPLALLNRLSTLTPALLFPQLRDLWSLYQSSAETHDYVGNLDCLGNPWALDPDLAALELATPEPGRRFVRLPASMACTDVFVLGFPSHPGRFSIHRDKQKQQCSSLELQFTNDELQKIKQEKWFRKGDSSEIDFQRFRWMRDYLQSMFNWKLNYKCITAGPLVTGDTKLPCTSFGMLAVKATMSAGMDGALVVSAADLTLVGIGCGSRALSRSQIHEQFQFNVAVSVFHPLVSGIFSIIASRINDESLKDEIVRFSRIAKDAQRLHGQVL